MFEKVQHSDRDDVLTHTHTHTHTYTHTHTHTRTHTHTHTHSLSLECLKSDNIFEKAPMSMSCKRGC